MRHLRHSLWISSLAILSALLVSSGALAQGGIGGRPGNPQSDNLRSQSIFSHTISPDKSFSDVLLVTNNSDERRAVDLYATDAILTNTGAITCKQRIETNVEVGNWTVVSKKRIMLDPGEKLKVPFTVKVPKNAEVGEHNGCIVIHPVDDEVSTQGNVRIRTRSAIQLSVTIPGELKRDVSIKDFVVETKYTEEVFTLSIKNTGNVSTSSVNKVYLKSLFGQSIYENGGTFSILPNSVMDLRFVNEAPPFWGGWFWAEADTTYDKRANQFGTSSSENLITKRADRQLIFVTPNIGAILLMTLFVLLILAAIVYVVYRRDERNITIRYSKKHTVKHGDTIKKLAKANGVKWKDIAHINQLKAPYDLEERQSLFIPPVNQTLTLNSKKATKTGSKDKSKKVPMKKKMKPKAKKEA